MRFAVVASLCVPLFLLAACEVPEPASQTPSVLRPGSGEPIPVKVMLDWVPNTNHSGLFVAEDRGYFRDGGLDVEIVQPGEVLAPQAVTSGVADFGVDFQEQVTIARSEGIPIVSIAAILQHNTSGFASPAELGVESPADWEGLRYGSFGSPFEEPTLRVLMECNGGDPLRLDVVNTGFSDPLALLAEGQTDLEWIFYGWQGIQAELNDLELDILMMEDYADCLPDYYTPVIVTSERTIDERPELVSAFLDAVARGYGDAIDDPEAAAAALLRAAPELDAALVDESQAWVSPRYQADASRWGVQSPEVWSDYAQWMVANGVIDAPIDTDAAFTNDFLP